VSTMSFTAETPLLNDIPLPDVEVAIPVITERSSTRSRAYIAIASTLAIIFVMLGFSQNHPVAKTATTQLRSLLELTIQGDRMPVPFWIIRQDVPDAFKVQNAFYDFYYLRDKKATLVDGDLTYVANFWEGVKVVDGSGNSIQLGYFNPITPKGLPSNIFIFEYGDKFPSTGKFREGQLELQCGENLEIVSVSDITPGRVRVVVTTPERCSVHKLHPYLKASSVAVTDNAFWTYKVNFMRHSASLSPVFQFHSEGADSKRILLGSVEEMLDSNKNIKFSNGDICEGTQARRQGTIKMECGCEYQIAKVSEVKYCVYEMVVQHPAACENTPKCDAAEMKKELIERKRDMVQLEHEPVLPNSFPRDLLHVSKN